LVLFFNKRLPKVYNYFFQVIGLFTLFLGISMALETSHVLHMIMALILGALVGEALQLQKGAEQISGFLKKKLNIGNEKFTEGLLTAFLLYCMGSLTILGAIEEGMGGSPKLLYIKSFNGWRIINSFGIRFGNWSCFFNGAIIILSRGNNTICYLVW